MGKLLKDSGIIFDTILTSAHKRAILSAKHILESFPEVPVHLMPQIHEVGGVYMNEKTYPGLSFDQTRELLPQLQISEEQETKFGDHHSGWFKNE